MTTLRHWLVPRLNAALRAAALRAMNAQAAHVRVVARLTTPTRPSSPSNLGRRQVVFRSSVTTIENFWIELITRLDCLNYAATHDARRSKRFS